jgi:hypothetical protein
MKHVVIIALLLAGCVPGKLLAAGDTETIVASGKLDDEFLARALFHIGEFWIRVPPDTEFNRWLSQGIDHQIIIRIMSDPARYADAKNTRILSGTLMHSTAPNPTPATTDAVGRLPNGDLPVVHVLFLKDEVTGIFSAVNFETADFATVAKFDAFDDKPISIVIEIDAK